MPIMEWKENFDLGIEQFDVHHRRMVELLNGAYDNYRNNSNVTVLSATLNELFEYAMYHFRLEEQYLKDINYAGLAEHLEYHKYFSGQVTAMRKDLSSVRKNLPLEILTFLKNWLTFDISMANVEYIRCSLNDEWKKCA